VNKFSYTQTQISYAGLKVNKDMNKSSKITICFDENNCCHQITDSDNSQRPTSTKYKSQNHRTNND